MDTTEVHTPDFEQTMEDFRERMKVRFKRVHEIINRGDASEEKSKIKEFRIISKEHQNN